MQLEKNIYNIVRQAEDAYAIRIVAVKRVGYDTGNLNYILTAELDVFVLSMIEEQTTDEVDVMARTLKWLAENGYPSAALRCTSKQKLTAIIEGKPALMRQFLSGEVCWQPNENQMRQVGASMAALHQLPCPDFLPTDIYYKQDRFTLALCSGHDAAYEAWVKRSFDCLDIESFAALPKGLIHADIFADNVLFKEEELVAIIDFELACNYFFAFDLAMAIVGMCLRNETPCFNLISNLIDGYETIRALTISEIEALNQLTEYAAIMTSLWRYWRYQCYEPSHSKQFAYQEMVSAAKQIAKSDFSRLKRC